MCEKWYSGILGRYLSGYCYKNPSAKILWKHILFARKSHFTKWVHRSELIHWRVKIYTRDSPPCVSSFTSVWTLEYVWCKYIAKTYTCCKKNNSSKWVYRGGLIHVHVKTYICHICACDIREGKLWYQNVCSPADALELNTILQHNKKFISSVYALFGRPLETILTLNSRPLQCWWKLQSEREQDEE